jgi:hypothetical protein
MKNTIKKWAVIFVLALFLWFTALSTVMYFTSPKQDNTPELIAQCESIWWTRDEESLSCLEDTTTMISDKELCDEKWGTWYAENEVCID